MLDFIKQYFWDAMINHEGYNPVNTITYAIIALVALFFVYNHLKKHNMINKKFLVALISFILLGSTARVVVDSFDTYGGGSRVQAYIMSSGIFSQVYQFIGSLHIYDYNNILTISPGIYVLTALLFFVSLYIQYKYKFPAWIIGTLLFGLHLLILIPLIQFPVYPILIIGLAGFATILGYLAITNFGKGKFNPDYILGIFAHALDGAGTFIIIDFFNKVEPLCTTFGHCYGEQHWIPSMLGDNYGYIFFFAIKVLISTFAVKAVNDEVNANKLSKQDALFFIAVLMTLGLAPAIRNLLRISVGA